MMVSRTLLLVGAWASVFGLNAAPPDAVLLLNRGLPGAQPAGQRVGWEAAPGVFVTDHFVIGKAGESWVIDKVRTWGVPGSDSGERSTPGDLFERITLYGGLESDAAPADEAAAAAICACHGPIALAGRELRPGPEAAENGRVVLSSVASGLWQIDFQNLRWTVPGGASIQFGVFGEGRSLPGRERRPAWFSYASLMGGKHAFRLFETSGKPVVAPQGALPQDESLALNVQVWGHLLVNVAIRPAGKTLKVALLGSRTFDVSGVDPGSLRVGPAGAVPRGHEVARFDADGAPDLVLEVGAAQSGVQAGQSVACVTGRLSSGMPFEGCGLLPPAAKRK